MRYKSFSPRLFVMNPVTLRPPQQRSGMVLLVVLGMLTFFSILAASYLVYSNQSRQSAFVSASRSTRAPDPNALIDQALMKLIVGTADPTDPFYGEDLLSDYYGRFDAIGNIEILDLPAAEYYFGTDTGRFASVPVALPLAVRSEVRHIDDVFTGRVITFLSGSLERRSFRVLRSFRSGAANAGQHRLLIELPDDLLFFTGSDASATTVKQLICPAGSSPLLHMNGVPRNSAGFGLDQNYATVSIPVGGDSEPVSIFPLPRALQPNLDGFVSRKTPEADPSAYGDFDESYDGSDFQNWFLSHRDSSDGALVVTPSFHRPAVINYILNQEEIFSSFNNVGTRRGIITSLSRATFRPLPTAAMPPVGQAIVPARHPQFTGSSPHFGLRTPIDLQAPSTARFRLDQVAKALIGDHADPSDPIRRNPWDVDNDKDGIPDSIWMDMGLPVTQSPEGKLLRPLVAVMIEDLSARLNVNAHSNYELPHARTEGGGQATATWANSRTPLNDNSPGNTNTKTSLRGFGYGPAEITLPTWPGAPAAVNTALNTLRGMRYQPGQRADLGNPLPGGQGSDDWMLIRHGPRPPLQHLFSGYGYSVDPYGRGVVGLGRGGHLLAAGAGRVTTTANSNESVNTPYELDPTGRLAGDRAYSFADLEPLLRSNTFDIELLPQNLYGLLGAAIEGKPGYEHVFTTASVSDDSLTLPPRPGDSLVGHNSLEALVQLLHGNPGTLTEAQLRQWTRQMVAPELRLGRKLDVNRPFGNGVDDNGNGVIDEPIETVVLLDSSDNPRYDSNNNPITQETIDAGNPQRRGAFAVHSDLSAETPPEEILPEAYQGINPNYSLGDVDTVTGLPTDPRQLLARHLYVLMMALARDATFAGFDPAIAIPDIQRDDYRARRIAQWAVNVIDYRDSDSIMTRFHYDPTPFDADGWNPPPDPQYVVWGVEQPELIFSESLAMHDVRVRDTSLDTDGGETKTSTTKPDADTDQVRIPEGSLFLELYCPRPALDPTNPSGTDPSYISDLQSKPGAPREFYDEATAGDARTLRLRLDAVAPAGPDPGDTPVPVWRLAITAPHTSHMNIDSAGGDSPLVRRGTHPNTTSFEPAEMDELESGESLIVDRYVWFRQFANRAALTNATSRVTGMDDTNTFFVPNLTGPASAINDVDELSVRPGQFLTLAPRTITHLGSNQFTGNAPDRPSYERFEVLADQGVVYFNRHGASGNRLTPALGFAAANPFAPAKPLVIGTFHPGTGWENVFVDDGYVGLNVSEPMPLGDYYPPPTVSYDGGNNYPREDAYVDMSAGDSTALPSPLDVGRGRIPAVPGTGSASPPGEEPFLGGIPDYCTVFLQRLADPTRPYDELNNPYRSVDWISVDLNVFSGEESENDVNGANGEYLTQSRQRNGRGSGALGIDTRDVLFSYETNTPETATLDPAPTAGEPYFKLAAPATHIRHSLSFLNTRYPLGLAGADAINGEFDGFSPSIGMTRNVPPTTDGAPGVTTFDRNLPQLPYAQHPWLNRPFATPMELMMVPASSAGRLFEEFSIPSRLAGDPEVYGEPSPTQDSANSIQRFHGPFRHLLNFFYGDTRGTAPTDNNDKMKLAEFSRLFEFVHTLPAYRGEVELLTPDRGVALSPDHLHRAPFNFLYDNRRQGRINLNTLADFPAWVGLMQGHMTGDESTNIDSPAQLGFRKFLDNRRGYDPPGGSLQLVTNESASAINYDPSRFDPRLPTDLAGVYRSHLTAAHGITVRDSGDRTLATRATDASFLRRDALLTDPSATAGHPLFVREQDQQPVEPNDPVPPTAPGGPTMQVGDYSHSRFRNAFTRYQTAMRMPNLASDNSQLYLVRMTIGLFETDPLGQLGREYNEEMGQNRRYEAMFIIDRSQPVGFIPGQTLNARDVVVFEKYYQ